MCVYLTTGYRWNYIAHRWYTQHQFRRALPDMQDTQRPHDIHNNSNNYNQLSTQRLQHGTYASKGGKA